MKDFKFTDSIIDTYLYGILCQIKICQIYIECYKN